MMVTGVGEWCAPGPAVEQNRRWLLVFEDADRGSVAIEDENKAREAFARAEAAGFNCHLFETARREPSGRAPADCDPRLQEYPEVDELARAMLFKLRRNAYKGGEWPGYEGFKRTWKDLEPQALEDKLDEEFDEFKAELRRPEPDREKLLFEAADLSNLAMMLADVVGGARERGVAPVPRIVCLCGSTRFPEAFAEANRRLTCEGHIVLSVGWCGHAEGEPPAHEVKEALDALHLKKIEMADEVLVLDVDGYVGESTAREIAHAQSLGKRIHWLSDEGDPAVAASL